MRKQRGPKIDTRPFEVVDQHGQVACRCWFRPTASTYVKETVAYDDKGERRIFKIVRRSKGAM